jgi:hypothetical protein
MSTTGLGADPPRRLRGKKRRLWEAQAAQAAAAEAFSRMDAVQRQLRARYRSEAPPAFAALDAETEAQAKRYLELQDRNPVAAEAGKPELLAAATAFRQAAFDCTRQAERLEDFDRRYPDPERLGE